MASYSDRKSLGLDTDFKNYSIYQYLTLISTIVLIGIVFGVTLGEFGNWYIRFSLLKVVIIIDLIIVLLIVTMGLIADLQLKNLFIVLSIPILCGFFEYFFLMLLKTSFPIVQYPSNYLLLGAFYLVHSLIVILNYSKVEYTKLSHAEYEELMKLVNNN